MTLELQVERDSDPLPSRSQIYACTHFQCFSRSGQVRYREYGSSCFSVVVSGALSYATDEGSGLAQPGAILTGNHGEAFSYQLPSEPVMRSLVAISPAVTAGIAEDLKLKRDSFVAPLLPPSARTLHLYAAIRRLAALKGTDDELAIQTVANLMTIDRPPATLEPGRAERRRVTDVARRLRSDYAEPITLDEMADQANLSRYHFIRVFKQVIGESPRKYLVAARLRAAVDRLLETREPVISVALNTGFNDISHFTNTFRTAIGVSPRRLRAGA